MKLFFQNQYLEVGCDEAGRGCLAGPVVAGAVILPKGFKNDILTDSKQLSEKKREMLREVIEKEAIDWAVAFVSPREIDKVNILNASIMAMHRAVDKLRIRPEFIAVDGNKFKPYKGIPHQCCIKGDAHYLSIAAASVLAKTYRDAFMKKIHKEFSQYDWAKNKGYPTKAHRAAIKKYGDCVHHRQSFTLLPPQLKLDL